MFVGEGIWVWIIYFSMGYALSILLAGIVMFLQRRGIMHYKCRLLGEKKSFFNSWPMIKSGNEKRDDRKGEDCEVAYKGSYGVRVGKMGV